MGAMFLDHITTTLEKVGSVVSVLGETKADVEVLSDALVHAAENDVHEYVVEAIRAGIVVALLNDIEEISFTCH